MPGTLDLLQLERAVLRGPIAQDEIDVRYGAMVLAEHASDRVALRLTRHKWMVRHALSKDRTGVLLARAIRILARPACDLNREAHLVGQRVEIGGRHRKHATTFFSIRLCLGLAQRSLKWRGAPCRLVGAVDVTRICAVDVSVLECVEELAQCWRSIVFAVASEERAGCDKEREEQTAVHRMRGHSPRGDVGSHLTVRLANGGSMQAIEVLDDERRTLAWREISDVEAGPGEVVVSVRATAVNRADLLQRRGLYPPPPGASHVMGLEAAGVVESVGEGVDDAWIGRPVAALLAGGGYAEKVAVPQEHLLEIHESLSFEDAAAIPEVFYTAYLNIFIEAQAARGETVMVHAAASGVGTAALQLCRQFDCPVIATASGGKLDDLPELGARHCVDRHEQSFVDVVADVTDGRGVDVILDPVGATYLEDNVASLAPRGRLVVIGLLGGMRGELDLGSLLRRRLRVIGSVLRSRSNDEKTEITRRFVSDVWPHFADGKLQPVVDRVLDIADVEQAHGLLERNETVGKVVLRMP